MTEIDAISFDLDDTLWAFAPAQARAEASLLDWLRLHVPATAAVLEEKSALAQFRQASAAAHPEWAGRLDLVRRDSIRCILAAAGADLSLADQAYEGFHTARQSVDLHEDVLPALRCLRAKFPLIAITNGNSSLVATGVAEFFQSSVMAYDVGFAKPDPRIFYAAAQMLRVAPHRMLHVGDDLHVDVAGAKSAGLQAAWLVRSNASVAKAMPVGSVQPDLVVRCLRELCVALGLSPWPAESGEPTWTTQPTASNLVGST